MKKITSVLYIIILICFIGITALLGYRFLNLKNENNSLIQEIDKGKSDIDELDREINDLDKEIDILQEDKKDLFTEYQNWLRQNKKLEEVLK